MKIHWVSQINEAEGTSWARCGKLVQNEQAYTEDGPAMNCRRCLAGLRRDDRG